MGGVPIGDHLESYRSLQPAHLEVINGPGRFATTRFFLWVGVGFWVLGGGTVCMYLYAWSSHIAEYGSTG